MTSRTRYFVIVSLLVLTVGVGTGLLAYYVGRPGGLLGSGTPDELRYVPRDAAVVAYADVREIMLSDVRQKIRRAAPGPQDGQKQFQEQTGIDIESDIDHVVASLEPGPDGRMAGLVIARGRFSDVRIEALMRQHGGEAQEYGGKRVIVAPHGPQTADGPIAVTFLEPGLVAVGADPLVRAAIDRRKSGDDITTNGEVMSRLDALDRGNAWAIGRLDAMRANGRLPLPPQIAGQLPSVTWFSVSGRLDSDVHGVIRLDARDEDAANALRDVVKGFLGLAKLQAGDRPGFQTMMQSLELGGTGKTVSLSFSIPGEVFDAIHSSRVPAAPPSH
jgi:hypothetical protein